MTRCPLCSAELDPTVFHDDTADGDQVCGDCCETCRQATRSPGTGQPIRSVAPDRSLSGCSEVRDHPAALAASGSTQGVIRLRRQLELSPAVSAVQIWLAHVLYLLSDLGARRSPHRGLSLDIDRAASQSELLTRRKDPAG